MFRLVCSVLITCTIAPAFQQTESESEKDVYAIYSLMLTNPQTSHGPDHNPWYLIAPATVPGTPQVPCVTPPEERAPEFREVLVDFEHRKATQQQLKPAFSIPKPYFLLSADEVKAFIEDRASGKTQPGNTDERFRGVADLFTLTGVYFNPRRTLALTAISSWCGSLCALYQWKVLEKTDTGLWQERNWGACATIARNSSPSKVPIAAN